MPKSLEDCTNAEIVNALTKVHKKINDLADSVSDEDARSGLEGTAPYVLYRSAISNLETDRNAFIKMWGGFLGDKYSDLSATEQYYIREFAKELGIPSPVKGRYK